jgi:3',5'-cyclic-AMP phosphodiesterase
MSEKLTFVHLTDLHVGDPSVPDESLLSDTNATLRAVLAEVKRLSPAPAFMVVSGDVTNRGDDVSYAAVKTIFAEAELDMPVLFALGNHDGRAAFRRTMLGQGDDSPAPYDHDAVIEGLHVITLDTSLPGRIGGGFEPGQLDWLTQRLEAHPALPRLLVMHHAPMLDEDDPATEWEALTAADTARLRKLLAPHDNIVGILSGHIHYDRVSNWHGIPIVVGIGQHAATDVLFLGHGLRSLAGASFVVGTIRPSGLTVSFVPQPSDRRELGSRSAAEMAELVRRFGG